jgi:hypothetical protein
MRPAIRSSNFILPLPIDWEDGSQLIAIGPERDGFRMNMVFATEPVARGISAAEFAAEQLPRLEVALDQYELVSQRDATFGPNVGYLREHRFAMEGSSIAQLQFHVVHGGTAYTMTFTQLAHYMDRSMPIAERLLSRVRIVQASEGISDVDLEL